MAENQKKILEMLADKKISVEEAQRLLELTQPEAEAPERSAAPRETGGNARPKYLRVTVRSEENGGDHVNVRVPISLIRAGMKLTNLIPPKAYEQVDGVLKEKGIDFDLKNIKPENIQELVDALEDLEVDIQGSRGREHVRVCAE